MSSLQILLASLAMDLKRVAMASYRNSEHVTARFIQESLMRKKELETIATRPHIQLLLSRLDNTLAQKDSKKRAEDALMYSTLFQNAAVQKSITHGKT
jgi:hypothetical protein